MHGNMISPRCMLLLCEQAQSAVVKQDMRRQQEISKHLLYAIFACKTQRLAMHHEMTR